MKKLVAILIALNCVAVNADERYTHEYSSEHDDDRKHYEREREEWHQSESRNPRYSAPRYEQNYQQPPIQIYLTPNVNPYSRSNRHHDSIANQYREERYWRERREELEQQPQKLYRENQFYRDDTHW